MNFLIAEIFPSDYDYVITKESQWKRLEPIFRTNKIFGIWKVAVSMSLQFVLKIIETNEENERCEYYYKLNNSDTQKLLNQYPQLKPETSLSENKFWVRLQESGLTFDPSAAKYLYYNTRKAPDLLDYVIAILKEKNITFVKKAAMRNLIYTENIVYANDIVTKLLLTDIGFRYNTGDFDKYRNFSLLKKYEKLCLTIGNEATFYAIRKALSNLWTEANSRLKGEAVENDIHKYVSVYDILALYLEYLQGNPNLHYAILINYLRRKENGKQQ